jgi:hypothetical protein
MKESLNILEEYMRSKAKPLRGLFGKFGQGGGR